MNTKSLIAICSVLFAGSALAQTVAGSVSEVQGIVTVTDGVRGGTVTQGSPIIEGSRFVTSSNGTAVLRLASGCVIKLQPGQAITIENRACDALLSSVQSVGATTVATSSGTTGLSNAAAVGLWSAGVAATVLNDAFNNNRPISSN